MPLLINGKVSVDVWEFVSLDACEDNAAQVIEKINKKGENVILPVAIYSEYQHQLDIEPSKLGIHVTGDDDLSELLEILQGVSLIAIDFPVLRDGRGYSIARNVSRSGFAGEIRAVGDVGFDRLDYMQRSGFNAFQITEEQYTEEMVKAFTEISVNYQPTHSR